MLFYSKGGKNYNFSSDELRVALYSVYELLGKKKKVLAIPPDFTRFHSRAGELTYFSWEYYKDKLTDILPALGTHYPMTKDEIKKMFLDTPIDLFREHNWRNDIVTLGEVPADFLKKISEGKVNYPWPAQVNKILIEGNYDLILSIGQVVPHEVIGMANYNKNIFIGTGGAEGINKSHFLGAAYGMERILGRAINPVREVLNYASKHFLENMPVIYILTVVGADENNKLAVRGLFIGDDLECFKQASKLSLEVNVTMLEKPLSKVLVYLDPSEFKSTWLGNKSIYRTRMAIADGGELIVLAPGVKEFGEDKEIDKLIRKYGYIGIEKVLEFVKKEDDLKNNLSAAAHLIHGSSEGRFKITYCTKHLTKKEVESVNFQHAVLSGMLEKYNPEKLNTGYNKLPDGEKIYFIPNPAIGLWAFKDRFK